MPSSIEMIGYFAAAPGSTRPSPRCCAFAFEVVRPFLKNSEAATSRPRKICSPALYPALSIARTNEVERFGVRFQIGRETAFVADRCRQLAVVQDVLQVMERFDAGAQRFAERLEAGGDDHELLHVEVVVGVRAAVDDVHHRHRQRARARSAEVLKQRQARRLGCRAGDGQRHAEDRVRAEVAFVLACRRSAS